MKTAAVVSSLITVGSLAFAAGQSRVAVSDAPALPPVAIAEHDVGGTEEGGIAAVAGDACYTLGEPLNWFTKVHLFTSEPSCQSSVWGGWGTDFNWARWSGDANADGLRDDLVWMKRTSKGYVHNTPVYQVCTSTFQGDGPVWCKAEYSANGGDVSVILRAVLSEDLLLPLLQEFEPPLTSTCFFPLDMTDMDGDGDLDMVIRITANGRLAWAENTSVANPPLAADINNDGVVDGRDLATVLASWTP
jgi:hypothetical protein